MLTTPNIRYIKHLVRLVIRGRGPKTANDDVTDGPWDDGHINYFTHQDLGDFFSASASDTLLQELCAISKEVAAQYALYTIACPKFGL